ncbi:MAG: endolytic transglycosylase MltG [Patescibacteria group bacterium]
MWPVGLAAAVIIVFVLRPLFFARPAPDIISIEIESGETLVSIADELARQDIILSPFLFRLYGKVSGQAKDIKAGSFEIAKGTGMRALYSLLTDAGIANEEIMIPEGWTVDDIAGSLEKNGFVDAETFILTADGASWSDEFSFLPKESGEGNSNYEGYFFPDTYRFSATRPELDLPRQAFRNFQKRVIEGFAGELQSSDYSLHEIIIIASILQAEVRKPEDMIKMADILEKRLKAGMALQMDSTVNFATGKNNVFTSAGDRATDSPYNTYKYPGLPPGPINNPGLDAIRAALKPETNPYYYFLTADDGTAYYAKTLDEHNANRARYLK